MKNFRSIFLAFLMVAAFAACKNEAKAPEAAAAETPTALSGTYTASTADSKVMWKGDMLGLYSHSGNINLKEGSVTFNDGKISGGKFVVDMTTIVPTDDGYNEENPKENLVGHLSSPEFFDIANNPTAMYEITGMTDQNEVTGNLTVRGKTNPAMVKNVVVTPTEGGAKVTGNLVFDRTQYDVKFQMPVKEKVLSNDISIDVELALNK